MQENFQASLGNVLLSEGGFVNDPLDPGGATNKGITQLVYDSWRLEQELPKRTVKLINDYETGKIYKAHYWDKIAGDELPSGLDYCTFDFAVNSGVSRAIRFLQRVAAVSNSGTVDAETLAAIKDKDCNGLIDALCLERLQFLQTLKTFDHFGKGWTNRINEVKEKAHGLAKLS
jgi:lysozyme family protein